MSAKPLLFTRPVEAGWEARDPIGHNRSPLFFRLLNTGNPERRPDRAANPNRQKIEPEPADHRLLLSPVMLFVRHCFGWMFFDLTGGKFFLPETRELSPFQAHTAQGPRRASAGPCKALFLKLKPLFLLGFFELKKFANSDRPPAPCLCRTEALASRRQARLRRTGGLRWWARLRPMPSPPPVRRSADARCGSAFPSGPPARSGPVPAPTGPAAGPRRPSSIPCGALR